MMYKKKDFSNEFNFLKVWKENYNSSWILLILSIAQKRKSSARKQQLAAETVSNGHLVIETDRLLEDNEEQHSSTTPPSPSEFIKYSHQPIRNSQSIPYLNQTAPICNLNTYSFVDIDIASSLNEQKASATPKSIVSHNISLATTNLSTYSTQDLLRKLVDKAQILDEYYKDISNKPKHPPSSSSLSSSLNSLLEKSATSSQAFIHRNQSKDNFKKSPRKKYRNFYDNISSDSSRFNLYTDEDNILRELICFNNDIDLILSRLEMEGENVQQQTTNHSLVDENPINPKDLISQIHDE